MTAERIMEGYVDRAALAAALKVSTRTLARYEALPNGLPSLEIGGRKHYRLSAVQDWLKARERRPNPRRDVKAHFDAPEQTVHVRVGYGVVEPAGFAKSCAGGPRQTANSKDDEPTADSADVGRSRD